MIEIFGVYRSRALRNIWLLEEMGLPHRVVPVIQAARLPDPPPPDAPMHTRSPEFLAMNPAGGIPAMRDGEVVLSESLAINLYLARRYGPPVGTDDLVESAKFAQWTLFAATEIEPHSIRILFNRVQLPEAQRDEEKVREAVGLLRRPFAVLDAALAGTGHPVGGRFTAADVALAECVRYCLPAPEALERFPRVKAWMQACHDRPAWKRIMAEREKEPA